MILGLLGSFFVVLVMTNFLFVLCIGFFMEFIMIFIVIKHLAYLLHCLFVLFIFYAFEFISQLCSICDKSFKNV